jgi:hypothetical protein
MVSTLVAQIADPCKLAPAGLSGRFHGVLERYQTDTPYGWATPCLTLGQA